MNGPTAVETWALKPEHVAALGFSSDQAAALNDIVAGKCTPLHAARVLRPGVFDLDLLPPFAQPPDSTRVRQLRGLLLLCGEAFESVADDVITSNHAVVIGYRARGDGDLQVRAIQILADRKTSSFVAAAASVVLLAKKIIDEVFQPEEEDEVLEAIVVEALQAVEDAIEKRIVANSRDHAARTWKQRDWSKYVVCSLIAFRDPARICQIEDERGLRGLKAYGSPNKRVYDQAPEVTLLAALKHDKLRAIKDDKVLEPTYWFRKDRIDDDVSFRREDVLKEWYESSSASLEGVVDGVLQAADVLKESSGSASVFKHEKVPASGESGPFPQKTIAATQKLIALVSECKITIPQLRNKVHNGGIKRCPSADNLRLVRRFAKRGSGSSGLEFRRPAADAASVGLR